MWDTDDLELNKGEVVGDRWLVRTKLGQGAFGAVFEVVDEKKAIKGIKALKLESVNADNQMLKVEIAVLKSVEAKRASKHVCILYACGCTDKFNFMVMTLLGQSVQTLRKCSPQEKFTINTSVMIAVQCLQAIQDLHHAGWLHRDIKPSNFAFGTEIDLRRNIFIFDFGLGRIFLYNKQTGVRKAREGAGMRGTVRYCSLNAHREKELGRQDDLISLQYMLVELATGSVPWKHLHSMDHVAASKLQSTNNLFKMFHPTVLQSHQYYQTLSYEDAPDYEIFRTALNNTTSPAVRKTLKFDWEKPSPNSSSDKGAILGSALVPATVSPAKS